jgi:hypothetical protein
MAGRSTWHRILCPAAPKEPNMKNKVSILRPAAGLAFILLSVASGNLIRFTPLASAEDGPPHCVTIGGALMTNIDVIAGQTNLGPVSGDLAGSVAATILGQNGDGTFNVQHYWVTASAETIKLNVAILHPTFPVSGDPLIVAVPWGNYRSTVAGGTGKFKGATGYIDYFGIADFHQSTLVLRYRGQVCYAHQ